MGCLRRYLFISAGSLFLALGVAGIFLPLLPTTPFLLLAGFCFARGSERLHRWLMTHPVLGDYLDRYCSGRGFTLKFKLQILSALWITLFFSAVIADRLWVSGLLFLIGAGVTIHILHLPTCKE